MADGIADGRLIPLLILDTSERPDLEELLRIHKHLPSGDVETQWGLLTAPYEGTVALIVSFKSPVETVAVIGFDIAEQGILVEQVLAARMFFMQAGRPGDRFITNPGADRVFVEVADTGFGPAWSKLFPKYIAKALRKKYLIGRLQAKRDAADVISRMRQVVKLRMKQS